MVIKTYIAAGFFNSFQNEAVDYLEKFLDDDSRFKAFSPRRETKLEGFEKPEVQKKVFNINVDNVTSSDLVICSTIDKDMGAIFEAAIAFDNKIPVIYTFFDERFKNSKFNLMLGQSGIACFTDKAKFEEFMNKLTEENLSEIKQEYEGDFE